MKNLLIFASGSKTGGGSGARKVIEKARVGDLPANIVGLVSNHANGGVFKLAKEYGIPFFHFEGPYTAENYQQLVAQTKAEFIALSGWLKLVKGLPPERTFNIHPGPLPRFGGPGMYGHHVHEAVIAAYRRHEVTHSEVCMHFVTDEYDRGPVFFRCKVEILPDDTPETLAARVNGVEHWFQWEFTKRVINGQIHWNGKDPSSLFGYQELVQVALVI